MRDFRSVFNIIGVLLCIEAIAMLIPMIIDIFYGNSDWQIFFFTSVTTFLIGLVIYFSFRHQKNKIKIREAFFLTIISWILIAIFASLPFIYSSSNLNYSNAFFESISGITTTGATVISNLDVLPQGILIWRSLLQWFGGIGIIVLALAILPTLQIGGMQLLHMEHDDPYEKTLPKINQFVFEIFIIYLFLTFVCAILYFVSGMSVFDAVAHAMTTISTGGFSTHNTSLAYFNSFNIESVSILFMIVGSLPFVIYLKMTHGDWKSLINDDQIKLFFLILLLLILITTYWLKQNYDENILYSLRITAFNITSILTGTGYTISNYGTWGGFGLVIMLFIMFIGGCAGSTTGGIKIFRLQLLFRGAKTQIKKYSKGFEPLLPGFVQIPFNDLNALKNKINETTAAVMIETVQGEGGIRPIKLKLLDEIRTICDQYKILLFLDEVQCGFGRSGKLFSYEWSNIEPDVMAVAKGIGSGFPMGACLATNKSTVGMTKGTHGSTYGGNHLAVSVGKAVIIEIMSDGFLQKVDNIARYLWKKLKELENKFEEIIEIRGAGLLLGIKTKNNNQKICDLLIEKGLLTVPANDNIVRLAPPLIITNEEVDQAIEIIKNVIEEIND